MSEYIFDEVYGSEAKRKKITQNSDFLYYRQIMKIKNKHITNPSLYSQIYRFPQQNQQVYEEKGHNKFISSYSPDLFSTLNQNNYTIQKLNSHAFKIIKRKKQPFSSTKPQSNKPALKNNYILSPGRKLQSRTIDRDANEIRSYLKIQQKSNSRIQNKSKHLNLQFSPNKKLRTITTFRKTEREISPFSTIRNSGVSFIKF